MHSKINHSVNKIIYWIMCSLFLINITDSCSFYDNYIPHTITDKDVFTVFSILAFYHYDCCRAWLIHPVREISPPNCIIVWSGKIFVVVYKSNMHSYLCFCYLYTKCIHINVNQKELTNNQWHNYILMYQLVKLGFVLEINVSQMKYSKKLV